VNMDVLFCVLRRRIFNVVRYWNAKKKVLKGEMW